MSIHCVWGPPQSGKTTLAIELAYGICRTEHSVCLISPAEFSEYSALLGTASGPEQGLLAALKSGADARRAAVRIEKYFYVLAMPAEVDAYGSAYSDGSVRQLLAQTDSTFDFVLVDCPSQPDNLLAAWALNRAKKIFLCLGSGIASPMWHSANARALGAVSKKTVPVSAETAPAFDYAGLQRTLGYDSAIQVPHIPGASAMQSEGERLMNAGGRAGRRYIEALNTVYEVMQS